VQVNLRACITAHRARAHYSQAPNHRLAIIRRTPRIIVQVGLRGLSSAR